MQNLRKNLTTFKKLSAKEIAEITAKPSLISLQEKGVRSSLALPYEFIAMAD